MLNTMKNGKKLLILIVGGMKMRLKTAMRRRILELCGQRNLCLCELERRTGIRHTTMCNVLNGRNHSTTLRTLQRLCEGLDITIPEFFDSDYFRDLEQEIL